MKLQLESLPFLGSVGESMRPLVIAVLGAAALVLLQIVMLSIRYLAEASVDPVLPASDSLTVMSRQEPAAVTSEQSFALQARPVFWPSRRPLDPPAVESTAPEIVAAAPAKQLKGLSVSGILANGTESRVIVTHKGEQRRLQAGETIDGWTLVEVRPDAVVFASAGSRDERRLSPLPVVVDAAPENKAGDTNVTEEAVPEEAEQVESLSLGG